MMNGKIKVVAFSATKDGDETRSQEFLFEGKVWSELITSMEKSIIAAHKARQLWLDSDDTDNRLSFESTVSYPDTFPGGDTTQTVELQLQRVQTEKGFLLELILARNHIIAALTGVQKAPEAVSDTLTRSLEKEGLEAILTKTTLFKNRGQIDTASLKYAMSLRDKSRRTRAAAPAWSKKVSNTRQKMLNEQANIEETENKQPGFFARIFRPANT